MPLINCFKKSKLFSPDEQKHIQERSKKLQDSGMSEKEAEIKAVRDMQNEVLHSLNDIHTQLEEREKTPSVRRFSNIASVIRNSSDEEMSKKDIRKDVKNWLDSSIKARAKLDVEESQNASGIVSAEPQSQTDEKGGQEGRQEELLTPSESSGVVTDSTAPEATLPVVEEKPVAQEPESKAGVKVGDEVEFEWHTGETIRGKVKEISKDRIKVQRGSTTYPVKFSQAKLVTPEVKKARPKKEEQVVEYNSRRKNPIGIVSNGLTAGNSFMFQTDLGKKIKDFFKREFTSKGFLPKQVFDRWIRAKGEIGKYESQIKFTLGDIKKAIKEEYKGKPTDAQITDLNLALQGKQPRNPIPPKTQKLIETMRSQIDNLSNRFINEGVVAGDMSATFTQNLGTYITRSYRKHDDPFWSEFVPDEIKNKAMAFIRGNAAFKAQEKFAAAQKLYDRAIAVPADVKKLREKIDKLTVEHSKRKPSTPAKDRAAIQEYKDKVAGLQKRIDALNNRDFAAEAQALDDEGRALQNLPDEEVQGLINHLMYDESAPTAMLKNGKLGSKDLSILKQRGDIAPEIRALMGEYGDPLLNYARTITKMSNLIAKHHFLQDVKMQGLGTFLFEKPTGKYAVKIAAEGSKTMAPLNGLYTTPEIAETFEEFNSMEPMGEMLKAYMKINGYVKSGKTIFSVMTHARNFIGNLGFVVANGHWRAGKFGKAVQTAFANVHSTDQATRDRFKEYKELGVVQDSGAAGELRQYINDIRKGEDFFERLDDNKLKKVRNGILEGVQNLYQFEDDIYKIFAFENEYARYKKAYPGWTDQQVKEKAAEIVRNTYPTYSMVPKIVRRLRANPLLGTFVSFPAEVLRTTYNTVALAKEELANPTTRSIGAQRAAGMMAAMLGPTAISLASRAFLGIDDEEDEDLKKFVAPWQKDSEFIYLNKEGDKYTIIDMGYSDPHSYLKRPVYDLLAGEDLDKSIVESVKAVAQPFLSEELLAEKIIDLERNKTQNGDHVFNPNSSPGDRAADIYNHFRPALEPGTVSSLRRIIQAAGGKTDKYGNQYELGNEVAGLLSGQKRETKDVSQNLVFRSYEIKEAIDLTEREYFRVQRNKSATPEELKVAKEKHDYALNRIVQHALDIYHSSIRLGVDPKEARRTMILTRNPQIIKAIR